MSIVLNEQFEEDGASVYRAACELGCEGIVSKQLGSIYRRGRSPLWIKVKNPNAPAVKRKPKGIGAADNGHNYPVRHHLPILRTRQRRTDAGERLPVVL